jgi:hypothetical protein
VFDEADLWKPGKDMRKTERRIQVNIGVLGGDILAKDKMAS